MATKTETDGTKKALDALAKWLAPGNKNEAINFQITRLTDPMTGGSLVGGGDCSKFTPSGKRGRLQSQSAIGYVLDSIDDGFSEGAGINVFFDLNNNVVTLVLPVRRGEDPIRRTFALRLDAATNDNTFFFHGVNASDVASYAVTFALL
jgi:hypothetical protein